MSESAGSFFIELSSLFNPQGFDAADKKLQQSSRTFSQYFSDLNGKSNNWGNNFDTTVQRAATSSAAGFENFFNITSKGFLNFKTLSQTVLDSFVSSVGASISKIMADLTISGIGNLFGGVTSSFFGGLLGSRRSGGSIPKTGPYLLHEGEFVLPPELVSSIKQSRSVSTILATGVAAQQNTGGGSINITVNTPFTINGSANNSDAKKLCEDISAAARRGVSWAVEQAKISYKIGKQKSGESSL